MIIRTRDPSPFPRLGGFIHYFEEEIVMCVSVNGYVTKSLTMAAPYTVYISRKMGINCPFSVNQEF